MKKTLVILPLMWFIPGYLSAQVEGDTVSREVLENYIADSSPFEDTVDYYTIQQGNPSPEFPGGRKALIKYANDNIEFPQSMADTTIATKIHCWVAIDKSGKAKILGATVIENGKVEPPYNSSPSSKLLFHKVYTLLETFPLFRPGLVRGEKKDFLISMSFYFTKDTTALQSDTPYFIPVFPTDNPAYRKLLDK